MLAELISSNMPKYPTSSKYFILPGTVSWASLKKKTKYFRFKFSQMLMIQCIFKRAFLLINLSRKIFYVYFISNILCLFYFNCKYNIWCFFFWLKNHLICLIAKNISISHNIFFSIIFPMIHPCTSCTLSHTEGKISFACYITEL